MENQIKKVKNGKITNSRAYTAIFILLLIIFAGAVYGWHEHNRTYISAQQYDATHVRASSGPISTDAISTDGIYQH